LGKISTDINAYFPLYRGFGFYAAKLQFISHGLLQSDNSTPLTEQAIAYPQKPETSASVGLSNVARLDAFISGLVKQGWYQRGCGGRSEPLATAFCTPAATVI
jgi:hypothetical protein